MKRLTAGGFYRFFNALSTSTKLPENAGDFRLIDRKVVEAIKQLPERNRFMKGLFAWAGFRAVGVPYERPARHAGETKFNYWKLWNFALDGLMSFSSWPLRVWSYIGVGVSFIAFLYILKIITQVLFFGIDVPGYASLMSVMLFLGGIQLLSLGIIGEYIGRMFVEVKQRPVYLIEGVYGQYAKQDEEQKQEVPTTSKKALARRPPRKPLMISRSRRLNDLPRGILAAGSLRFCRRGPPSSIWVPPSPCFIPGRPSPSTWSRPWPLPWRSGSRSSAIATSPSRNKVPPASSCWLPSSLWRCVISS